MSEKKIVVPEGMLEAGRSAYSAYVTAGEGARRILEAALRWLSENPIVPTEEQISSMIGNAPFHRLSVLDGAVEWQRRMFVASEPEVPEEIKYLQRICLSSIQGQDDLDRLVSELCLESFHRGQKSPRTGGQKSSEPEVPEAVKDLLVCGATIINSSTEPINHAIIEAYRRATAPWNRGR